MLWTMRYKERQGLAATHLAVVLQVGEARVPGSKQIRALWWNSAGSIVPQNSAQEFNHCHYANSMRTIGSIAVMISISLATSSPLALARCCHSRRRHCRRHRRCCRHLGCIYIFLHILDAFIKLVVETPAFGRSWHSDKQQHYGSHGWFRFLWGHVSLSV